MKHIYHLMDKYEDVGEALSSAITAIAITTAIVGIAPLMIWIQSVSYGY